MSTLNWVITGVVVAVVAYATQSLWVPPVKKTLSYVPYLDALESKVSEAASGTGY